MIVKGPKSIMDKICRTCMCENDDMKNLFNAIDENDLQLSDMLMACSTVQIQTDDGLPSSLCIHCEAKLTLAYKFKQQCEQVDLKLRKVHANYKIKQEIEQKVNELDNSDEYEIFEDNDYESDYSDSQVETTKPKLELISEEITCVVCNKQVKSKKGLKIHMAKHAKEAKNEEKYICDICGSIFDNTELLNAHQLSHSESFTEIEEETGGVEDYQQDAVETNNVKIDVDQDGNPFQCMECGKVFSSRLGLKVHLRKHNSTDIVCKICNRNFTKSIYLKKHMLTHGIEIEVGNEKNKGKKLAEKQIMECDYCDRKFKYKKSFLHHMVEEHAIVQEEIPINGINPADAASTTDTPSETISIEITTLGDAQTVFTTTEETETAEEPKEEKSFACHVCDTKFPKANHLTRHMTLHKGVLVHKCTKCDKAFATEEYLAKHLDDDHVNKPYSCTVCSQVFKRGELLIHHLKTHTGTIGALQCSVCNAVFNKAETLARHIKVHIQQDKRHVCADCGKAFNRLDNLKTHQRVHNSDRDNTKVHLCVYCGKEFNNSSNMIVHMRRHTGDRPYKCKQCGKGFPRSHDLKCHERTHSGEKPYLCTLCGKSFNKSNKLLRHTRVHTGERPYVCNLCGRGFTQSNDLSLHMRRHTGARPYSCGICPARFIQSGQLKSHRKNTGHWMETQPDLKGGHRVEPVITSSEPKPIKFKNKTRLEQPNDSTELKPVVITHTVEELHQLELNTDEMQVQPLLVENKVLDQYGSTTLLNFSSVLTSLAPNHQTPIDIKSEVQGYQSPGISKMQTGESTVLFSGSFATVVPSTTANYTDNFTYQNYG